MIKIYDWDKDVDKLQYERVYDNIGIGARSWCCLDMHIYWNKYECIYQCPNCGKEFSREYMFNEFGFEPPSPDCVDCEMEFMKCKQQCLL